MENRIREYARLLVETGVHLKRGQPLQIKSPVDAAPFARLCAQAAYDLGAREVVMTWSDEECDRMTYAGADDAVFDDYKDYYAAIEADMVSQGAGFLSVISEKPGILSGVSADRIRRARMAKGRKIKPSHDRILANFNAWSLGAVPNPAWARLVFPGIPENEAMEKLWDAILDSVHVDGVRPARENWKAHTDEMIMRSKALNECDFSSLHYRNSLGTDLVVELPEKHTWSGGSEMVRGTDWEFSANMPTEEIFTLPVKTGVNGIVYSSMPLMLSGSIVTGIRMELKDGRIVSAHADENEPILLAALDTDDGARYLGEVSLVPVDSPISKSGIFFYNTLFDENAACHFAFGAAYPCFKDVETISEEEMRARGMNDSMTHVDFMVGTRDLSITGIRRDGTEVPVFRDGNFAL